MFDRDEWLDHPQIAANDLRVELDDPERGHVVMPGLCIGLAKTPGEVQAPAPRLGEHTETAGRWPARAAPPPAPSPRAERGSPVGAAAPLPLAGGGVGGGGSGRGPLAGVRALDLGTILAGPYAGTLLAGLGADVVKVESPAGDAFRETGFVYNRGMRGLSIDLSTPAGQQAFHRVVETADVVHRQLAARRPEAAARRLRLARRGQPARHHPLVAGFGEHGPFAHRPAFDPVLQAMSGMMTAQGGDSDPGFYTIPVNDVVAAVTAVLARLPRRSTIAARAARASAPGPRWSPPR